MKLKEMEGVAVDVQNSQELQEYVEICESSGWKWIEARCFGCYLYPTKVSIKCNFKFHVNPVKSITLEQFKKEQGIMKYKEGDVLENHDGFTRRVLGVCGYAYIMSSCDDLDAGNNESIFTESQLDKINYTLKTDEPELTEVTLEQVAEKMGVPVEQLRIKD